MFFKNIGGKSSLSSHGLEESKKESKMSSKKKMAIAISAVCVIVIAAIVAVVAVWAARNANAGSEFSGSYTANHVDATITGQYKIGATVADQEGWTDLTTGDSQTTITFVSSTATGEATQSFNAVSNIVLNSTQNNVIFKYTITNTSSSNVDFNVVGEQTGTFTNLTVEYKQQADDAGEATDLTASGNTTNPVRVNAGESVTIYVVISIDDLDQNASLDGSVNWTLTAIEPTAQG